MPPARSADRPQCGENAGTWAAAAATAGVQVGTIPRLGHERDFLARNDELVFGKWKKKNSRVEGRPGELFPRPDMRTDLDA